VGLDEGRARLSRLLDAAQMVRARSVYLTTGGHGSLTWEEAAHRFAAAIEPCIGRAADAGTELLVENIPPLRADLHIARSLHDTIKLADIAGIGVCIDVNGCWSEAGLDRLIEAAMPRCHLVQLSDYVYGDRSIPGRAVPGDGDIPLARIIGWILEAGYEGAFDLELIGPRIDREGHLQATTRASAEVDRLLEMAGV
jgi:sugar phosphate isomerase/epimerase